MEGVERDLIPSISEIVHRLFTKATNCLAEEHMNVAITKGERSYYGADRDSKRFEKRETRQLIDRNNN